jgi:hypothetical protein
MRLRLVLAFAGEGCVAGQKNSWLPRVVVMVRLPGLALVHGCGCPASRIWTRDRGGRPQAAVLIDHNHVLGRSARCRRTGKQQRMMSKVFIFPGSLIGVIRFSMHAFHRKYGPFPMPNTPATFRDLGVAVPHGVLAA